MNISDPKNINILPKTEDLLSKYNYNLYIFITIMFIDNFTLFVFWTRCVTLTAISSSVTDIILSVSPLISLSTLRGKIDQWHKFIEREEIEERIFVLIECLL